MGWRYPLATSPSQVEQISGITVSFTHHSFPYEINRPVPHLLAQVFTFPRQLILAEKWDPGMNVLYWDLSLAVRMKLGVVGNRTEGNIIYQHRAWQDYLFQDLVDFHRGSDQVVIVSL